jgi:hypothetical protein
MPRARTDDRRYHTAHWRRTAKAVLRRDGYVCRIVDGCPRPATVADHIVEVHPGMSDGMFFGMGNLRAGCGVHNRDRGVVARLQRESGPASPSAATSVVTSDYTKSA